MTSPWILVLLVCLSSSYVQSVDVEEEIQDLRNQLNALARHFMKQQFHQEDKLRAEGNSGVKRIRLNNAGTKPYHHPSHTFRTMASAHDHDNHERTVGLGELHAVLNGWDFRTRHNDYPVKKPSDDSMDYHATDDIPFPEVPPQVAQLSSLDEQIVEMREWFKAWRDQDHTVRDYRPYFKPILCYLEGAWEYAKDDIEEPFESDRHFLDASSWVEMDEKVAFMAHTGRKDSNENFASLPTKLMSVENGTFVFARWNYRILCHPVEEDLPINKLCPVDDLAIRMAYQRSKQEQVLSRSARFQLDPLEQGECNDGQIKYGLLDKLMAEVPGKDNYPGYIEDSTFNETAYDFVPKIVDDVQVDVPLNAARYHRWYRLQKKGALGLKSRLKSFSDPTVFMAQTSSTKVVKFGVRILNKRGRLVDECQQRWSFALPLEIVYLTPLHRWNPLNIVHHGDARTPEGQRVSAGGRRGGRTQDRAYDGTNSAKFYHTPASFFNKNQGESDPADSSRKGEVGVLNSTGHLCLARASGVRNFLPEIPGVGMLRTRFPIMPVHGEGDTVWKELAALKDTVLNPNAYPFVWAEPKEPDGSLHLLVGSSESDSVPEHTHFIVLSAAEAGRLLNTTITVETSETLEHTHSIELVCARERNGLCIKARVERCDGVRRCPGNHPKVLNAISPELVGNVSFDI